jgi:hypothetical protein
MNLITTCWYDSLPDDLKAFLEKLYDTEGLEHGTKCFETYRSRYCLGQPTRRLLFFFRHRQGSVPGIHKPATGHCFRRPRTTAEKRFIAGALVDAREDDCLPRPSYGLKQIVDAYDDKPRPWKKHVSWKSFRKTQYKISSCQVYGQPQAGPSQ